MLPFLNMIVFAAQYVFPAVETAKVLRSNSGKDALVQWTVYWVLICLLLVLESWLSSVLDMLPLYGEIKLLGLAWLILPDFEGASVLWHLVVKGPFQKLDELVSSQMGALAQKLKPSKEGEKLDKSSEPK
jgi:receptor expression-enhancing protein 5/6